MVRLFAGEQPSVLFACFPFTRLQFCDHTAVELLADRPAGWRGAGGAEGRKEAELPKLRTPPLVSDTLVRLPLRAETGGLEDYYCCIET